MFRLNQPLFEGDPGDGGTQTGSLLSAGTNETPPADENASADANADASAEAEQNNAADPFGDYDKYKDDKGLYFGRYKTVNAAIEAIPEMDKELGRLRREKSPTAPETYGALKLDREGIPEEVRGAELTVENDEGLKHFDPVFKKHNVSQELRDELVTEYIKWNLSHTPDLNKVKQDLGAEADTMIQEVNTWNSKYITKPEYAGIVHQLGQSADGIKFMSYISKLVGTREPAAKSGQPVGSGKTAAEMKQAAFDYREKHKETFDANRHQQQIYEQMLEEAARMELGQQKK